MKRVVQLFLVGSILMSGCYAKCINSSHKKESQGSTAYVCKIKNTDEIDPMLYTNSEDNVGQNAAYKFRKYAAGPVTVTICVHCGCDISMHDAT